jgi:hypothetical protein
MISMKLIKKYSACKIMIVICIQELEEPGQDTRRYDTLCPTVVKPKSRVLNVSALAITSPTSSGLSVSIVRSRTQTTEFSLVFLAICH